MNLRLPTLLSALSIAGFFGWTAAMSPPRGQAEPAVILQERALGSEVPCAVPLSWRIARIDPEFDLSLTRAETVVREAAALWESGVGRPLFTHDPENGFPIRLVFDDRQELLVERQRRQEAVDELDARVAMEQDAQVARNAAYVASASAHMDRVADFEDRVSAHNATVRQWTEAGDLTDARRIALAEIGDALQREQEELATERRALNAEQEALSQTEERLNERVRERNRLAEQFATEFPVSAVEAGEYREAVRRVDGRVDSVSREIRLYRFGSDAELRLLAAHELGHALGLDHTEDATGVMHATASADQPAPRLSTTDVALFGSVCPESRLPAR
jgi:hypothetical protein